MKMNKILIVVTCSANLPDENTASRAHEKDIEQRLEKYPGFKVKSMSTSCETVQLFESFYHKTFVPRYRSVLVLEKQQDSTPTCVSVKN
jgi:hypothetical protein